MNLGTNTKLYLWGGNCGLDMVLLRQLLRECGPLYAARAEQDDLDLRALLRSLYMASLDTVVPKYGVPKYDVPKGPDLHLRNRAKMTFVPRRRITPAYR